ncbi:MAG: short-chain dehydrogenase [Robiginitomaculum sp.]|nr:MAG: short-chain dehydrogenase [Robiginitomaculum sp.]
MTRVLITGTNQGIGLEMAKQYAARGDEVIATCRSASDELQAAGCEVIENIDVTSADSIAALAQTVGDRPLDILINNAGILTGESFDDLDFDRMRTQYEVNTLGPLRVTHALNGNLKDGAKIGIVTSRVGSLDDNSSGGMYGYRLSKTAANMAGVNLSHDMRPRGIAVALLHPGYVRTNMTNGNGMTDAHTAAAGLIERMDALSMDTTGTFWHAEGYELPW